MQVQHMVHMMVTFKKQPHSGKCIAESSEMATPSPNNEQVAKSWLVHRCNWILPTWNQWQEHNYNRKFTNFLFQTSKTTQSLTENAECMKDLDLSLKDLSWEFKCTCSLLTNGLQSKRYCMNFFWWFDVSVCIPAKWRNGNLESSAEAWTTLKHQIKAQEHLSKNSMQMSLCSSVYVPERLHVQNFTE